MDQQPPISNHNRWRTVLGWGAVITSTAFTSFWAFWGIIENFHEGWYHPSLVDRIVLMFAQYLSLMLAFLIAGVVSIRWQWFGAILHIGAAAFAIWFFDGSNAANRLFVPPMLVLAVAYAVGRIEPRKRALKIAVFVPLVVLSVCAVEPIYRAATRIDDGGRGARRITGNGVDLVWAPEGPGWPTHGMDWDKAVAQVARLEENGLTLSDEPQNIWRLPTVEEAVRSMSRHGKNSGGQWDAQDGVSYETWPDKETPLWNPTSKVIYWWTSTEISETEVYSVSYRGRVNRRSKEGGYGYRAFRAVRIPR